MIIIVDPWTPYQFAFPWTNQHWKWVQSTPNLSLASVVACSPCNLHCLFTPPGGVELHVIPVNVYIKYGTYLCICAVFHTFVQQLNTHMRVHCTQSTVTVCVYASCNTLVHMYSTCVREVQSVSVSIRTNINSIISYSCDEQLCS